MTFPGSLPAFAASMVLVLVLAVVGLVQILSHSGSSLIGLVLLVAAGSLRGAASKGRAAYLHRRNMAESWQWAQGLGPRKRQERRRL